MERYYLVEFGYPWKDERNIIVTLPEGYKVEVLPESVLCDLPENMGSFEYRAVAGASGLWVTTS